MQSRNAKQNLGLHSKKMEQINSRRPFKYEKGAS